MSAIRNSSNRSEARKQRSNPYGRGLFSAVARLVNFFVGSPSEQAVEPDGRGSNDWASAAHSIGRNAVQSPKSLLISDNRAPLTPSKARNGLFPAESSLPVPSAEQVASFFSQRMGTNVTPNEVDSMITNLQTTPEHERFKFTFTTPGRELSPSYTAPHIGTSASPRITPPKKLSRNPNGVYRWEGAGSSKYPRRQNRFGSPAFGASPSKPKTSTTAEQAGLPVQDNKRRKIGDGVSVGTQPSGPTHSTNSTIPFPNTSPSTPRANGNVRSTSPLPSRVRTPAKATAPVNPSPLRQAWSDASSTSSHEDNRPSPPMKQTKTANFVAELIKETATPNKPDLTNPYQAASPVGKVGPPRRSTKRPRASARPVQPSEMQKAEEEKKKKEEEEQMKALSVQAIIEATLPKGSKRSRPPAHLEKKTGDTARSGSPPPPTSNVNYVVEEAEDEEHERLTKRSKPTLEGQGHPSVAAPLDVSVEEVRDVVMQPSESDIGQDKEKEIESLKPASSNGGTTSISRSTQFAGFKSSSVPREPSKLRFSIQAESPPSSNASTPAPVALPDPALPSTPAATLLRSTTIPGPSPPSIQTASNGFNFTFTTPNSPASKEEIKPKHDSKEVKVESIADIETIKAKVRSMNAKLLPTFVLTSTATTVLPSTPEHAMAREATRGVPVSSLPAFDFSSSFSFGFNPSKPNVPVNPFSASKMGTDVLKPFDFEAAGLARPTTLKDTWNCTQCGLSNPEIATKCNICDEAKPGAAVSKPSTPAVVATPPTVAPAIKPFDWSAAGIKPPTVSSDTWTCGLCGLSNPKSATKCTTCDAAGPADGGSSTATSSLETKPSSLNMFGAAVPKPATSGVVKGFDFAAAGLKPPTIEKGTWVCSLCGLSNLDTMTACTTCENPK